MLRTGAVAPLGPRAVPSGIVKQETEGPVYLSVTGFDGDAQAGIWHHGGRDKAVHHCPLDDYHWWRRKLGPHPLLDECRAFGENISVDGILEDDAIRHRYREPCFLPN